MVVYVVINAGSDVLDMGTSSVGLSFSTLRRVSIQDRL